MFNQIHLRLYRNIHYGQSCFVCGLGPSLKLIKEIKSTWYKIGMEDIGAYFTPDYLTCIHTREQLQKCNDKKRKDILDSKCSTIFSTHDLGFTNVYPVHLPRKMLNGYSIEHIFSQDHVFQWKMGFMITLSLALFMGFKEIGLIGIDFAGERIVNPDSDVVHRTFGNEKFWSDMDNGFQIVNLYCKSHSINIYNLSPISVLTHFPKVDIHDFCKAHKED